MNKELLNKAINALDPSVIPDPKFDKYFDDIADAYFHSYAGITLAEAKAICEEHNLDFEEEFWKPFLAYEADRPSKEQNVLSYDEWHDRETASTKLLAGYTAYINGVGKPEEEV